MNNVNAPTQLAEYAAKHGIDLAGYHENLKALRATGRFIDPDPPFANGVLARLRAGMVPEDAVAEARQEALDHVD